MTIAATKEKVKQALMFHPLLLKTAAATLTVCLAVAAFTYFAPEISAGLSQMAKQAVSQTIGQVKKLAVKGLKLKYLSQVYPVKSPLKRGAEQFNGVNPIKSQFAIGTLRVFNGVKK
jgi:hypothetical protein